MSDRSERIAVIGVGRMGRGIAHVFAYAGYQVDLIDLKERAEGEAEDCLNVARAEIAKSLGMMRNFGQISADQEEVIQGRISYYDLPGSDEPLALADVVFEGVPERLDAKREAFQRLGQACRADAIITSTTSTILVDELADMVDRPERFLNGHWLNPAYLVPLVEVSPGGATDQGVVDRFLALMHRAGKIPVVCKASPGFIVPRIQALAMNEAARMAEEGVASPEDIDQAIRVGFGLRFAVLGLLEFIDWGGGDILYYASGYLKESLGSDRFEAPDVVRTNMEQGRTGMHAGEGFYDFKSMDVDAYQKETIAKFVDLLEHLKLLPKPSA